jgi:hypothetical protein
VSWQGQEPYSIRIGNALHGLVTLRANERFAWLTFIDQLFRTAYTPCRHWKADRVACSEELEFGVAKERPQFGR